MDYSPYLLGLDLTDKSTIVFGGGGVASRKIGGLYDVGAHITVISPHIGPSISGLLGDRVTHLARPYQVGDCMHAWLVIAATNDPEVNAEIVAECAQEQIFCIRVDAGPKGTAVTPAQNKNEYAQLGVLTGEPRRSVSIRNYLLQQLAVYAAAEQEQENLAGTVALIGAGPGAADLITVRGQRLLSRAEIVIADRLGTRELLEQLDSTVTIIDAAKNPYGPGMPQSEINDLLVSHARAGKFVIRLKGGDPYIFGRGFEEFLHLQRAAIPVQIVPGLSSALAVPALAHIPLSYRGINHAITIVSAHISPDHSDSLVNWGALAQLSGTLVILMGITHIARVSEILIENGMDPTSPAAIIEQGSTPEERIFHTSLEKMLETRELHHISAPAVLVIGEVAGLFRTEQEIFTKG